MHKYLLLTWAIVMAQVATAQVKDTVRENIDYRRNYSLSDFSKQSKYRSLVNVNKKNINYSRNRVYQPKDTVREEVDYRRNYDFHRSYKYRQGQPFSHYCGIQLNAVFHEMFRPDSAYIKNPFALTYSINHKRKGFGLGIGYGFTEWGAEEKNVADNVVASINSRMNFRVSLDKKSTLGKRFIFGFGLDMMFSQYKNIRQTIINGLIDEERVETSGWGMGPRVSLQFKVDRWIYAGTETSLYFRKLKTYTLTQFTGLPPENESVVNKTTFDFFSPLAIFVSLKIN